MIEQQVRYEEYQKNPGSDEAVSDTSSSEINTESENDTFTPRPQNHA